MLRAIGEMLPAAMAVALSPFPVIAIVLVLGGPRARRTGPAFALGWLVGLSAVAGVVTLLVGGADEEGSTTSAVVHAVQVLVGLAMIGAAAQKWRTRPRAGDPPKLPGWMATVERADPGRALGLGLLLAGANPKNVALTVAATSSTAELGIEGGQAALAALAFVLLGSWSVLGPVVAHAVVGDRVTRPLQAVKQFMQDNNVVIMMVVLLVLGAKILGDGIAGIG